MELPIELKNEIEGFISDIPLKKLIAASETISSRYRNESGTGKSLINNETEAAVYAVVRMPATLAAAGSAIRYAANRFNGDISDMLDIGAGTGACCWAAQEIFPDIEKITCLEREKEMISFGKKLMSKGDFPIECEWINKDITSTFIHEADLVTASYVLNELSENNQEKLVKKLWSSTKKMLVIVEPGTPIGFKNILAARKILIDEGAKIIAPCPHSNICPLPDDDWCHFTARTSRTKLHKQLKGGDAPYEDEKYCYIAVTREAGNPCTSRVVRHPKIESGKITLKLCTSNGIAEKIVTKKDGKLFKAARKSSSGDDFPA